MAEGYLVAGAHIAFPGIGNVLRDEAAFEGGFQQGLGVWMVFIDALVVKEAFVSKGLVMKRFSPRARGRVGQIQKPFANLTIVVREVEETA